MKKTEKEKDTLPNTLVKYISKRLNTASLTCGELVLGLLRVWRREDQLFVICKWDHVRGIQLMDDKVESWTRHWEHGWQIKITIRGIGNIDNKKDHLILKHSILRNSYFLECRWAKRPRKMIETTGFYFLYKIELSYLDQMGQFVGSVPT